MENVPGLYIGDDWIIPLTLTDNGGNPLNLSLYTVGATYFAPTGTSPSSGDMTSNVTVVDAGLGTVTVVIPKTTTAVITALPVGRKGNLAHLQVYTTETATGYRVTRRVAAITPLDPSSFDPRPAAGNEANYTRVSIFPFGEAL